MNHGVWGRSIPAHTGSSRLGKTAGGPRPVHPRAHGEQCLPFLRCCRHSGPPPYARGRVGSCRRSPNPAPVHPRTHGDERLLDELQMRRDGPPPYARGRGCDTPYHSSCGGPPPYARGRVCDCDPSIIDARSTPVRTGRSRGCILNAGRSTVHPRTHGEESVAQSVGGVTIGPPPRTRGRGSLRSGPMPDARFTPAHTGSRVACAWTPEMPHGPSPRTRGRASPQTAEVGGIRSTPVRTGNRSLRGSGRKVRTVHPRAQGEQENAMKGNFTLPGPSQYSRGTVEQLMHQHLKLRSIPVRTGKIRAAKYLSASICGPPPYARGRVAFFPPLAHRLRSTPVRTGTRQTPPEGIYRSPVHPRTHGEKQRAASTSLALSGAPPYARGRVDA